MMKHIKLLSTIVLLGLLCIVTACNQTPKANNTTVSGTQISNTTASNNADDDRMDNENTEEETSTQENDNEAYPEFEVIFRPEFDETIYPSLIFGFTEIEKLQKHDFNYFTIWVNTPKKTNLRFVIQESTMNFETVINKRGVIGEGIFVPTIKWKYEELKKLSQPGYVDITFICYNEDTGREIGRENLKLRYRAINECVIAAVLDDELLSLHFMVAAYVNEDSQIVDEFLAEVLRNTPGLQFVGYQADENYVVTQVEAVFNTLRKKGVKYSSITATSNTQNPYLMSQYIRFSDEVLKNSQANCADGTAFLCSVLKKIGIRPVMIFVPGHVYLGYYLNDRKTQFWVLETTLIGSNLTFHEASAYQVADYEANYAKMMDPDPFNGYLYIEIDEARSMIKPIGR